MRSRAPRAARSSSASEKAGIVQAGVGKASFSEDKLIENIKAFADAVQKVAADRRQGSLHQPRGDVLDHGTRREGRARELVPGFSAGALSGTRYKEHLANPAKAAK